MNYLKMQQEIVKEWEAAASDSPTAALAGGYYRAEDETECIAFVTNNRALLRLIPKEACVLSFAQLTKTMRTFNAKALLERKTKKPRTPGKLSGVQRARTNRRIAVEMVNADGSESVWLDPKLLSTFDKGAEFLMAGPLDTVIVTENGVTVGMVCPINPKGLKGEAEA